VSKDFCLKHQLNDPVACVVYGGGYMCAYMRALCHLYACVSCGHWCVTLQAPGNATTSKQWTTRMKGKIGKNILFYTATRTASTYGRQTECGAMNCTRGRGVGGRIVGATTITGRPRSDNGTSTTSLFSGMGGRRRLNVPVLLLPTHFVVNQILGMQVSQSKHQKSLLDLGRCPRMDRIEQETGAG